jgi:outer membrane lipase/esterase
MPVSRSSPLSLLLTLGAALLAAPAGAVDFSEVYFFGDSLSDTGRSCTVLTPAQGYDADRCSNGPVWADVLVSELGLSADSLSSASGGPNYADGGAFADELADQIADFDADTPLVDPGALYAIWIGANDVLSRPTSPLAMQDAVDDVMAGIGSLSLLGAESFLIVNLPNFGRSYGQDLSTPWTGGQRNTLEALSLQFNALLADGLAGLSGLEIHTLDAYQLFEDIAADPATFGFDSAHFSMDGGGRIYFDPCRNDAACSADPMGAVADDFVLYDWVHPSTATHDWIGVDAVSALPEPGSALLLAAGLGGLGAIRGLERRAARR